MFRLIKKYLKGYGLISLIGPLLKFFEAVIELFIPLIVALIIDNGIANSDMPYIRRMGGLMLLLYTAGFALAAACQFFAAKSAFGYGTNLRKDLFAHINRLPLSAMDGLGAGALVTRLSIDINNTQNAINRFIRLATRSPFILIGALIMSLRLSPPMALIILVSSVIISAMLFLIMRRSAPVLKSINRGLDEGARLTAENLAGTRAVRAHNMEAAAADRFAKTARGLKKDSARLLRYSALTGPLTYLAVNVVILLILYFGGASVYAGRLTQGQVVALINYMLQILNALVVLAMLTVLFTRAATSAKRINQVLETKPESGSEECSNPHSPDSFRPCTAQPALAQAFCKEEALPYPSLPKAQTSAALEFKNVSLTYASRNTPSLNNISLSLQKGQTLGIIGGTGSGKTSLLKLLPRLYDYDGEAVFFGESIKDINLNSLRSSIAFVPQTPAVFSGNVRENIDMGRGFDDEILAAALNAAKCDFAVNLDSALLRGGKNLSGGQKQRLSIARALAGVISGDAKLLILDDSFSALDYTTEYALRKEIEALGITKIIVSGRALSIKNADLILVLDEGNAVGLGKHGKLLQTCDVYKDIVRIQNS